MLMLAERPFLSNRMKISIDHEKLGAFSQKHASFYLRYSSFVYRALEKPAFQKFLKWMLKKEEIEVHAVKAVHIKVLPLRKSGQGIAGKCDPSRGRIRLYPKTIKFCQMFKRKFGRSTLFVYAGSRARVALIHELLHLKYIEDEKTVRGLAEIYFWTFAKRQSLTNSKVICACRMIFKARSVEFESQMGVKSSEPRCDFS